MNREEAPGKSPEEMYVQQKVRVLLMLKKMGSNVSLTTRRTPVLTKHMGIYLAHYMGIYLELYKGIYLPHYMQQWTKPHVD